MKTKRAKIVIQPLDSLKSHWKEALKGELTSIQKPGVLVFTSLAAAAKVLSPARLELLGAVIKQKPSSIYALAKLLDRDFKNVHSDVRILTEVGLLELSTPTGKREAIIPRAKYTELEFDLAA